MGRRARPGGGRGPRPALPVAGENSEPALPSRWQALGTLLLSESAHAGVQGVACRHLDADEAVVLGAGLFAANLSTTFRLRQFGMADKVPYSVAIQLQGEAGKHCALQMLAYRLLGCPAGRPCVSLHTRRVDRQRGCTHEGGGLLLARAPRQGPACMSRRSVRAKPCCCCCRAACSPQDAGPCPQKDAHQARRAPAQPHCRLAVVHARIRQRCGWVRG